MSGTGSTQPREELLEKKIAAPVYRKENTGVGICHADYATLSVVKFGTNFDDKQRSIDWYSSTPDSGHRAFINI
jgi:hypothetical protein